jgi:putative molybdopterin biosynthesis protein
MSDIFMNTKEVADYLDIHEKQVYALIKAGRMPATRVTGKWIFPKKMIDEWIETQARAGLQEAKQKAGRIHGALLAAGSNDPVLDLLLSSVQASHPEFYIFTATMGSTVGLKALGRGYTDVAWCHLLDAGQGRYNTPEVLAPHLEGLPFVVVHLFNREVGLLVGPSNPLGICGFHDVFSKGAKIVNRQPGAGTRLYLDQRLREAGIAPETLPGYDREVFTHLDVGLAILAGKADAGIASTAVARLLGLQALPLTTESFDMVLSQPTFFAKGIQIFLDDLQSGSFQEKVAGLGGYDFRSAGRILHATA